MGQEKKKNLKLNLFWNCYCKTSGHGPKRDNVQNCTFFCFHLDLLKREVDQILNEHMKMKDICKIFIYVT